MRSRTLILSTLLVTTAFWSQSGDAAVVFKPGEKSHYVSPGEEEVSGTAQQLFQIAQDAENRGDLGRAIKAYRALVRKHPHDALAGGAAYRFAQLQEKTGDYLKAAAAYAVLVENYPKSPHFEEAIEAQFRIGEMYLNGKKIKLLGIPVKASMDRAIEIFAAIVRTAPFGRYTARAQFNIGLATAKQKNDAAAVAAFQAVVEKFPNDPLAADAQYQIGYIWYKAARSGVRDPKAASNAKVGFEDFLYRYPKSEKSAQARENLRQLNSTQTSNAFEIAKYYDKQKNYRAAAIYYNDVIRQEPGSPAGDKAKKRVDELRAKFGDKLQSAELTAATAKKPKGTLNPALTQQNSGGGRRSSGESDEPMMHTSPGDVAPLPPPEADESLPPPASLSPGTTTAPYLPPAPSASPTPEAAASPES